MLRPASYRLAAQRRARATSEAVNAGALLNRFPAAATVGVPAASQQPSGPKPPRQEAAAAGAETAATIDDDGHRSDGPSVATGRSTSGGNGRPSETTASFAPLSPHRQRHSARHDKVRQSQPPGRQQRPQQPQTQRQEQHQRRETDAPLRQQIQPPPPPTTTMTTAVLAPDSTIPGSDIVVQPSGHGQFAVRRWKCRTPRQLTAALYGCTSLSSLLAQLKVCGPLNAVQLCASLAAAEQIAAREGGGAGGSFGYTAVAADAGLGPGWRRRQLPSAPPMGLLAPPCRALTPAESAALATVLVAHSEVLADADPPELAATLWAAARLRLQLPPAALEPALEAIWMWDPADPTANRQLQDDPSLAQRPSAAGRRPITPAQPPPPSRQRQRRRDAMGSWEVCLLLYAVSVLWPEYVRQNAGGFLEALDSYESGPASTSGPGPRRGSVQQHGGGRRHGSSGGGGGLSCEQVVGVVAALARADVALDEVEEEFLLLAVSSRLSAFSLPHLTALLSAAQHWAPLRTALHGDLLAALLARLDRHHVRFMEARKERREAEERRRRQPPPPPEGRPLPSRVLSALMRQLRLRAVDFSSRDVCEALAAMAALRAAPSLDTSRVVRWKEGLRGLLRRWIQVVRQEAMVAAATAAMGEKVGDEVSGSTEEKISGTAAAAAAAAAARTFSTSLHAVSRLGVRLQRAESEVAVAAAVALVPYMSSLVDCVMVLTALGEAVEPEAEAAVGAEAAEGPDTEAAEAEVGPAAKCENEDEEQRGNMETASAAASAAAAAAEEEEEAGGWLWLKADGVLRLDSRSRRAARLVLERAAELIQKRAATVSRGSDGSGGGGGGAASNSAGELVCLIRAAASLGAWPPEWWWRAWRGAVVERLPPALLRPRAAVTAAAPPAPALASSACFSLTEAVDVLYSLALLTHRRLASARRRGSVSAASAAATAGLFQMPLRRWRWQRRQRPWFEASRSAAAAAAAGGVTVTAAPLEPELLTALLAVACLGATRRRTRYPATIAAGGGAGGGGAPQEIGTMTVYYLSWAVARLRLFAPYEAALWCPRLAAAAPRALARLTPRKQVLMLRSLTWAYRGAAAAAVAASAPQRPVAPPVASPLPPMLAAAWQAAFAMNMTQARGQTLSYAAAAMAAARISPPAPWLARFRGLALNRKLATAGTAAISSQSQSQLSDADRQLARRLRFLLARGAAAGAGAGGERRSVSVAGAPLPLPGQPPPPPPDVSFPVRWLRCGAGLSWI
ncbi:hypothetical protein VOLCADRAFT_87768 [Volvox carteri f. nagariensis]|uniref:Uncharacterized protein n=1 Tax=Volvox carteri f. nagariensis TaxID=3068 RepID=D8TM70_VOLCA|nr:uncharacterized protein VOLCADRAFT_87768 [Volvox carteri f. nagariensis]EFJ51450.1 hypothetical protein VOLCADRAFT_87768 [Volvox carteri f. nagariensis]|eukprot:XP_002947402.1 hypothetical protein VOLCADRAFT_87768 [Volvox carteri f. nagariensis]